MKKRNTYLLLAVAVACAVCALAADVPQSPREMALALESVQSTGVGVVLPDPEQPYRVDMGPVPLGPGFTKAFRAGLAPVTVGGVTAYPVAVRTDDATGEMRFSNALDEAFWTEYPSGVFSADWVAALRGADAADPLLLPSHVEACFALVDARDHPAYCAARADIRRAEALARQRQNAARSPAPMPPLNIASLAVGADALHLAVEWPGLASPPGNAFDLFHADSLGPRWRWLERFPAAPGTDPVPIVIPFGSIPFGVLPAGMSGGGMSPPDYVLLAASPMDPLIVYTNAVHASGSARASGFLRLGTLTDTDGDGLTDAFERLAAGSDPDDPIDAILDTDGDGLPNSYELHYGTNPLVPDSGAIPKLFVTATPSAPNEFATFQAAFNASAPYSVIEVKDGVYEVRGKALFPSHPVLLMSENWGRSRNAVIRINGRYTTEAAFLIHEADNRTIVRGLHLRVDPPDVGSFRFAFWVGADNNRRPGAVGASPVFESVTVELADARYNTAFYILNAAPQPVVFINCVIAQRLGIPARVRGVYAIDPPPLIFENCTFLGNPACTNNLGVQLETTAPNYGAAAPVIPVAFNNCLWDAGFSASNGVTRAPFAKLEQCPSTAFSVAMRNCVLPLAIGDFPLYPQYLSAELVTNLFAHPVTLATDGHLRASLPCTGAPSRFAPFDLDGQPRDPATPAVGADEFLPLPGPPDANGITPWDKVTLYGLSPTITDYDNDLIDDTDEILGGTSPFNSSEYCFTLSGTPHSRLAQETDTFVGISFTNDISGVFASAPVEADGSFALPHTAIFTNTPLRLALFRTNGVHTGFISIPFKPTAYRNTIALDESILGMDNDRDGIPDWWETLNGLDPTDSADAYFDPDSDFLINLHEYWCGTDAFTHDANITNNLLAHIAHAIDSRIAGKDPAVALPVFDNYTNNAANGIFIRNPACWAADIDLTCCSPWHNYVYNVPPFYWDGKNYAGTLISPRHVLFAAHFDQLAVGTTMTFVDRQGQVITRTLAAKRQHPNYYFNSVLGIVVKDLTIGILNADVPPSIMFAKVIPDDYADYLHTGRGLPCVRFDQEEKALVGNVSYLQWLETYPQAGGRTDYRIWTMIPPVGTQRRAFHENIMNGDSGNPMFILINSQPVILTVWTSSLHGSGIHVYKSDLNVMMSQLSAVVGASTNYQLQEIDLTGFTKLSRQP